MSNTKHTPEQIFGQSLSTYWWNYGKKKNDFNGTIESFFTEKGIKVKSIIHPTHKDIGGFKFTFVLGNSSFNITTFESPINAAIGILKIWATYLGDRAQIHVANRIIDINK